MTCAAYPSVVDRHTGGFCFLTSVNGAVRNLGELTSLGHTDILPLNEYLFSSWMAGSYDSPICNFFSNFHNDFSKSYLHYQHARPSVTAEEHFVDGAGHLNSELYFPDN